MEQLALDLGLQVAPPETVLSRCNEGAYGLVDRWPTWAYPVQCITGPEGSGKSHLARAFASRTEAALLGGDRLAALDPLSLAARTVAVDDAHRAPERTLFHLINAARESGAGLLLVLPDDFAPRLRDLASRLNAAPETRLEAPDDPLLRRVMLNAMARRQLPPNIQVVDYLLQRMERTLHHAIALVEALDLQSLAARRGPTRPLAAQILKQGSTLPESVS